MSPHQLPSFRLAIVIAVLAGAGTVLWAQGLQPTSPAPFRHGGLDQYVPHPVPSGQTPAQAPATPEATTLAKPSPGVPAAASRHSMLDDPAGQAQVQLTGDKLSITATNASLSDLIRQVASRTGMQVEGNSRDERVFGVYGPGNPPEVLSALLYDSGYNVLMVGSMADGAPRRMVLSARTAAASAVNAPATTAHNEDEDDEQPVQQEQPQFPTVRPGLSPPGGVPAQNEAPKTPQQMLEELQRMHQGQQAPDMQHQQEPQ